MKRWQDLYHPLSAPAILVSSVLLGLPLSMPVSALAAPVVAAPSAPAGPAAPGRSPGADAGDFEFLIANLLAGDGSLTDALAAFEQAEKARPDAAYIHLEHAQLLSRLAQAARLPAAQTSYLRKAVAEVDKAQQIAPQNLDVLRGVGLINLELASLDPAALATALKALEAVYEREPEDVQTALNLGRIYLDQQQAAKAAAIFREVIHRSPQQRAAYALLVEALLRDEKLAEAEAVLAQILDFEPAAIEARLTLAELQGRRNDYAAVLATLKAAPEPGLHDPRVQRQLAWATYLTGDIDHALALVEPLLQTSQGGQGAAGSSGTPPGSDSSPGSTGASPLGANGREGGAAAGGGDAEDMQLLLLKGLVLAAQGHNQEASELLEKLRNSRPTDPALATVLSKVLERAGRSEQAARVLTELGAGLAKAGKHDEERQARLELAQVYYDAKQWDRVAETLQPLLRQSAREDAAREPALLLASDALVQRKSYDDALKLLATGQTEPPSPAVSSKHAEVLLRAGRNQEGVRQLEELSASQDPRAVLAAAEAYQRVERYRESIPALERLLTRASQPGGELQPPAAKAARFLLGAAYERTGKREEAVAEFRRLLGADPEYHAALNYLGYMFAERGEHLDEARKLVERAVALEPDNGAYVDSLGWVYFRLGLLEDARATLERATRLEITDGTVEEHLGDVYGALGQPERASAAYRRAIALEQTGDPAKAEQVRRKLDGLGGGSRRP
jgi:predicted Zn-dependent protease